MLSKKDAKKIEEEKLGPVDNYFSEAKIKLTCSKFRLNEANSEPYLTNSI